jgi:hypothetical protein
MACDEVTWREGHVMETLLMESFWEEPGSIPMDSMGTRLHSNIKDYISKRIS